MTDSGDDRREREIDKPLGQDAGRRGRGYGLPRGLFGAALAVAVVALPAAWIALSSDPFREVGPEMTARPLPSATEIGTSPPEPARETPAPRQDGPAVIKVQPDGAAGNAGDTDSGDSRSVIVIRDPSELKQNTRTAHLPDRALIEQSQYGSLPVTGPDGRRPFDVYAGAWSGSRGAKVAIVIGGLGLSQTGTQEAIRKLPSGVTLAFSPHGNSLNRWMQEARRAGHEILMQIPLEPFDFPRVNPGRNTLTVNAEAGENLAGLYWTLGRTTNYVGVMNYMGARFMGDEKAMQPVMADLAARGLMFLDDGSYARSLAPQMAARERMPFAGGDMIIDQVQDRAEVLRKLDELEAAARAGGSAIGIGSAFDVTVDTVANWVAEARRRGVEIVPVSALAADPRR
ncbi:divergent polysaccharide deacetylase family protein [Zhengella sp. ZM62]|uniref:divergent polysaccharide deacetylase family protein n=1 Tax=Zhengella sedimenti TaxID=3390035 RepID=UPI003976F20B